MQIPSPAGSRRRLPSSDRKQQILAGSETLFTSRGFEAVTMGDIARLVGVSRPTVYSYFTSTADILTELLDSHVGQLEGRLAPLLAEIHSGARARPFAAIFQELVQHRSLLTLLQSGSGPAFTRRRQQIFAELEARLQRHLATGGSRTPYLLTCVTILLHGTAAHAIHAQLDDSGTAQLATTLDRLLNTGMGAFAEPVAAVSG